MVYGRIKERNNNISRIVYRSNSFNNLNYELFMSLNEAIEILKEYNDWRLGAETEMLNPKLITEALEIAINILTNID